MHYTAKIFVNSEAIAANPPETFNQWIAHLTQRFITPNVIARRRYDFYDISQGTNELPCDLATRLQEAAHLAAFQQPQEIIEAIFIQSLLSDIVEIY